MKTLRADKRRHFELRSTAKEPKLPWVIKQPELTIVHGPEMTAVNVNGGS